MAYLLQEDCIAREKAFLQIGYSDQIITIIQAIESGKQLQAFSIPEQRIRVEWRRDRRYFDV